MAQQLFLLRRRQRVHRSFNFSKSAHANSITANLRKLKPVRARAHAI
jgi:hypothetical protein